MSIETHLTWTDTLDHRYPKRKHSFLFTAFTTLGVIYGDIGTSPLYVINGIFSPTDSAPSKEDVLGAISAIVWSITLIPLIKYSLIALEFGTTEGEGGPFALFSQLYPREPPGRELTMPSVHSNSSQGSAITPFMAKPWVKRIVRAITLFAVALIMSDGILTPSVSVVSAVAGIAVARPSVSGDIVAISIAILVCLFFAQRFGTAKLGFSFAPIVFIWLSLLGVTGILNLVKHPGTLRALDPSRAVMYLVRKKSITPLSGVLLAITGVEALFANLGQFSKGAIRVSFTLFVYPCLILAYLGQGARLIVDGDYVISNVFYQSIPGGTGTALWWIIWFFGILATIVASQAMITASFSLIQQMVGLSSFPPIRIVHTSDHHQGQIYAPVMNALMMIGCIGVTAGFGTDTGLTNAYGFAVSGVLLMTTFLLSLVMVHVKMIFVAVAVAFFVVAGFFDTLFFASSFEKIPHGAWFTLSLAVLIGIILIFWTWSKGLEDSFDAAHRSRLSELFGHESLALEEDEDHKAVSQRPDVQPASFADDIVPVEKEDKEDTLVKSSLDRGVESQAPLFSPKVGPDLLTLRTNGRTIPLPRLETYSFFHHLGAGNGAPHSFTALLQHQPALPRIIVFLSIRVVGVPYLEEDDKYLIDKFRSLDGFYVMTLRLGYRNVVDLRNLGTPVLRRIIALERGNIPPGKDSQLDEMIRKMEIAAANCQHILPSYYVTSKGTSIQNVVIKKVLDGIRAFLLEEIYRRVSQNFPVTSAYAVDESTVLRIGVNAAI